ncbi:MAG TPA: hypothetical protein VN436_11375, partial [Holophaga sp.]|nr:hypothetical protein [Holophaga sp.]
MKPTKIAFAAALACSLATLAQAQSANNGRTGEGSRRSGGGSTAHTGDRDRPSTSRKVIVPDPVPPSETP